MQVRGESESSWKPYTPLLCNTVLSNHRDAQSPFDIPMQLLLKSMGDMHTYLPAELGPSVHEHGNAEVVGVFYTA